MSSFSFSAAIARIRITRSPGRKADPSTPVGNDILGIYGAGTMSAGIDMRREFGQQVGIEITSDEVFRHPFGIERDDARRWQWLSGASRRYQRTG